jgi:hypothetical protein
VDFLDLGSPDAVDKTLQRLARASQLLRVDRGLYDLLRTNSPTKKPAVAGYRHVIDALARCDQVRRMIDGPTAANDLGLTTGMPVHFVVHTDARRRFPFTSTLSRSINRRRRAKLYWLGRPAMPVVRALPWLKDTVATDRDPIVTRLSSLLADATHEKVLGDDFERDCIRCRPGCRGLRQNCWSRTEGVSSFRNDDTRGRWLGPGVQSARP